MEAHGLAHYQDDSGADATIYAYTKRLLSLSLALIKSMMYKKFSIKMLIILSNCIKIYRESSEV
jgi:hypothetical protein